MLYYDIPNTVLKASSIILGCMRIAELGKPAAEKLVRSALENGINFFDHADIYGNGICEELFADAVGMKPKIRENMIIQSKCGIRKVGGFLGSYFDFSRDYIISCVRNSLKRLKTEYLDVLLLHRPDSLMEPDEVAEAFEFLQKEGMVNYFGVSNQSPIQIELLQQSVKQKLVFDQIQFGVAHTAIIDCGISFNTEADQAINRVGGILEYSRLKRVTLQAWSPFQYGRFNGVFLNENKRYTKVNEVIKRLSDKYRVNPMAIATAWILRHPAKIQVIIGTTKPHRIKECCDSTDIVLGRDEWYEIYKAAGNPIP